MITVRATHTRLVQSRGGVGGVQLQNGQTSIFEDGKLVLTVEEVTASVIFSTFHYSDGSSERVDEYVPAEARYSYGKTVMFWVEFLQDREAANASQSPVIWQDGTVDAPGFTTATFATGVTKARNAARFRVIPLGAGQVLVDTGKPGSTYVVERERCTCLGHEHAGHCYHRAAFLYLTDVCGFDLDRFGLVGFDGAGHPVVDDRGRRAA